MPSGARQIKTRLKSIRNTKKVTKAMELVAGAKMRRAVERALQSRQYTTLVWQLAQRLSHSKAVDESDALHRFFSKPEHPKRFLLIAFSSNRGLCGAYHSNILRKTIAFVREKGEKNVELVVIGKRLVSAVSLYGIKPSMAFVKEESATDMASIAQIAAHAYTKFRDGFIDEAYICYSQFKSALSQEAVVRPLFPFSLKHSVTADVEHIKMHQPLPAVSTFTIEQTYLYEPGKKEVLTALVPRLGEAELYQALVESNASEHSARMIAMKNATEAAGDMLNDLLLQYNRARQAGITQEIAEISAGSAALTS